VCSIYNIPVLSFACCTWFFENGRLVKVHLGWFDFFCIYPIFLALNETHAQSKV
jgi:hypothetical protein